MHGCRCALHSTLGKMVPVGFDSCGDPPHLESDCLLVPLVCHPRSLCCVPCVSRLNPALQVASQQMTGFNAQQYAKFLSGLAALNLAPPADIQEVLCDVQTAQRIVGSAMRVRHSTSFWLLHSRGRWPPGRADSILAWHVCSWAVCLPTSSPALTPMLCVHLCVVCVTHPLAHPPTRMTWV